MALPPLLRRMSDRDYPDLPKGFLDSLNPFLIDVGNTLRHGASFDNLNARVVTIDLTYPSRWTAPTLLNSWTNYDTATYDAAGYYKGYDGRVWLRGVVSAGTYGTNPIFTLPTGYTPAYRQILAAVQSSLFQPAGQVDVLANGNVIATDITSVQSGTSTLLSLDGLSFEASDQTAPTAGAPFPYFIDTTADIAGSAQAIVALACLDVTSGISVAAPAPRVSWQGTDGGVSIADLPGLLPDRTYRVTLWIQG